MLDSRSIVHLYNRVLDKDMCDYGIPSESIRVGIKSMREVYKPNVESHSANRSTVANFNDAAHRCAYLHKYAALHTAMVRDMMCEAIQRNFPLFHMLVLSEECFKVCSLGGGPGSDIIGVLSVLCNIFSFQASVSVVDYMVDWNHSFSSILRELGSGSYGPFGNFASHHLQWRYVGANLLKSLTPEVEFEISNASLVTMVKFVSAASCKDTEFMVQNIFTAMKPGAVLFFIDNDGGGYREMINRAAAKYNFISIFGPCIHENYTNEIVKIKRFGAVSCHKTTVSIHVLQKPPEIVPYVTIPNNSSPFNAYSNRRVLLENPLRDTRFADNPSFALTPVSNQSSYLSGNENFHNNQFHFSPVQSTPLTPFVFQAHVDTPRQESENRRQVIYSPETPRPAKHSRSYKRTCLPLPKFKEWRHHLSRKLNTVKSRASSALQKRHKKKKSKTSKA